MKNSLVPSGQNNNRRESFEIPSQLRDFRFNLLAAKSKIAIEKNWDSVNNYAFDNGKLLSHIRMGGGYGVIAGKNLIVDCDTHEFESLIESHLTPTFTQRTPGHGCKQFFYMTSWDGEPRTLPVFDGVDANGKPNNIGHVKGGASYVVGPGSFHPNGRRYEICDDRSLAAVSIEDILRVIAPYVAQKAHKAEKEEAKQEGKIEFHIGKLIDLYKIADLREQGEELYGPHPLHGSKTGRNFWINLAKNEWCCFRCGTGGGPLQLLAVLSGVVDCRNAQSGALRGEVFQKVLSLAQEKGLVPKITEDTQPHEMAKLFLADFSVKTFTDTDDIYVYDSGVYILATEGMVGKWLESKLQEASLDDKATLNFIRETIGHVRRSTYVRRDRFDNDPFILNLRNGLLDVRTREFKEHTPSHLSTMQLPVRYDPTADYPKFLKFLHEVSYTEDQSMLQETFGSTFWKGYPTKKATMLVGDGNNGKSTLIEVLKSLLGLENISARHLLELETNRFAKADLYGKLANLYADLPKSALTTVGTFKMLTGGDPITAERKFQHSFKFVNYAKLIFSCNKVPEVYEDTGAFFSRWNMVTFPNTFSDNDQSTDEKTKRANKNLAKELTTDTELSGVFNWSLEGLTRLRERGWVFSNSRSTEELREEYIRKSSPIHAFVMDCMVQKPDAKTPKKQLFQAFVDYCALHHLPMVTQNTFFQRLPEFTKFETQHPMIEGRRVWCVAGVELKPVDQWGERFVQAGLSEESSEALGGEKPVHGVQPVPVQDVQDVQASSHLSSHSDIPNEQLDLTTQEDRNEALRRLKLRQKQFGPQAWQEPSEIVQELTAFCDPETARNFVDELVGLGKILRKPDGFLELI